MIVKNILLIGSSIVKMRSFLYPILNCGHF